MSEEVGRRTCFPVLYTRGNHFEVGVDIGRTFQSNIETFLLKNPHLNNVLVEKYQSAKVRRVYETVFKNVTKAFPQYVDEIKGVAQGAKVPFFKLFLLHIDDIISILCGKEPHGGLLGSTTVCSVGDSHVILGHSQDGGLELLNLCYIIHVHILETAPRGKYSVAEEKFTALCLPGMLPGLYSGYNHHGMVFAINTVSTGRSIMQGTTPRHFLCRALLSCASFFDATEVLQDEGGGASDGLSVTMIFCQQDGTPLFHNAEVAPPAENSTNGNDSQLSVLTLSPGEDLTHCNKFLRLKSPMCDDLALWSSNHRHAVLNLLPSANSLSNVVAILGDQTDVMYSFFRDGGGKDRARTIVTGIFNLNKKTWSLFTQNPKNSLPVMVIPMAFK